MIAATKSFAIVSLGLALGCGGVSGSGDAPQIESLEPSRGSALGGTQVTITGSGFDADVEHFVLVGDTVTAEVTVASDTSLTFTSPAGAPGPADVTVISFHGSSSALSAFEYNRRPEIFSFSRDLVAGQGGELVEISGVGFTDNVTGDTVVRIGAAAASAVTVESDVLLTATAGPRDPGDEGFVPLDVVVENINGVAALADATQYTQPGLLAVRDSGVMTYIDPSSPGTSRRALSVTGSPRKFATLPDGTLIGTNFNNQLLRLDLTNNRSTSLAQLNPSPQLFAVTADAAGAIFGYQGTRTLVRIDGVTGVVTTIGAADPLSVTRGCIADRNAATLFYLNEMASGLFSISKTNSAQTLIRPFIGLPPAAGPLSCKSAAVFDGELYATLYARGIDTETMIVAHLNVSTGVVTEIARFTGRIRSLFATPSTF